MENKTNQTFDHDGGGFVKVIDKNQLSLIRRILKSRLPKSSHIYNMSLMYSAFKDKMSFHIFSNNNDDPNELLANLSSSLWIFATFYREDYGLELSMSAPSNTSQIPTALKTALHASSSLIDWTAPYELMSIDSDYSTELIQIAKKCTKVNESDPKMREVEVFHCYHYIAGDENQVVSESIKLEPNMELKQLSGSVGVQILLDTWDFTKEGSEAVCSDLVNKCYNVALYLNEEPVAWVILAPTGHLGPLHTLKDHRGHSYGVLCLSHAIAELVTSSKLLMEDGSRYFPCSMVDDDNDPSNRAHTKAGMKVSHEVDFIIFGRGSS